MQRFNSLLLYIFNYRNGPDYKFVHVFLRFQGSSQHFEVYSVWADLLYGTLKVIYSTVFVVRAVSHGIALGRDIGRLCRRDAGRQGHPTGTGMFYCPLFRT